MCLRDCNIDLTLIENTIPMNYLIVCFSIFVKLQYLTSNSDNYGSLVVGKDYSTGYYTRMDGQGCMQFISKGRTR